MKTLVEYNYNHYLTFFEWIKIGNDKQLIRSLKDLEQVEILRRGTQGRFFYKFNGEYHGYVIEDLQAHLEADDKEFIGELLQSAYQKADLKIYFEQIKTLGNAVQGV